MIQISLPYSIDTSILWKYLLPIYWKAGLMAKDPNMNAWEQAEHGNRRKRWLNSWLTMLMQMRIHYQGDFWIADIIGEYSILLTCHPRPPTSKHQSRSLAAHHNGMWRYLKIFFDIHQRVICSARFNYSYANPVLWVYLSIWFISREFFWSDSNSYEIWIQIVH